MYLYYKNLKGKDRNKNGYLLSLIKVQLEIV